MGASSVPVVTVEWGTAAMVVRYNPISAYPGLCLLVQGFVCWTNSAAVFPIDEHLAIKTSSEGEKVVK
jgi:energy-converting hydrogenase Eha subunit C